MNCLFFLFLRFAERDRGLDTDLIPQRRQHPVVEVGPQLLVNPGQFGLERPGQHPERDVGHLEVLGSRDGVDGAGPRAHVDNDRLLHHGDHEVRPLPDYRLLYSLKSVEDDRPLPAVDVEQTHLPVGRARVE